MRVFRFLQIDVMMTKGQLRILWLFMVIAFALSVSQLGQGNPYWGPIYTAFAGMIISTMPFAVRQQSNHGFLLMLPASVKERIAGRFVYGASLLFFSVLMGGFSMAFAAMINEQKVSYVFLFYMAEIAIGLIFISIQYTMLYLFGELKSQQTLAIIRMIPSFLFFSVGTSLTDAFLSGKEMAGWMIWFMNHLNLCAVLLLCVGILIFCFGFLISVAIVKKRDFA